MESNEIIAQAPYLSSELLKIILERDELVVNLSQLQLSNDRLSIEYSEIQQNFSDAKRVAKLCTDDIRCEVEKLAIELESAKIGYRQAEEEKASIFEQLFKAETEVQYLTIQLGVETNANLEKTVECSALQARVTKLEEQKVELCRQMQMIQDDSQTELVEAASAIKKEIENVESLRLESARVRLDSEKEVARLKDECEAYQKELEFIAKRQLAVIEDTNNNIRSELDIALADAKNSKDCLEVFKLEYIKLGNELNLANSKFNDINTKMLNLEDRLSESLIANTILANELEKSCLEKLSADCDARKMVVELETFKDEQHCISLKMAALVTEKLNLVAKIDRLMSEHCVCVADLQNMIFEKDALLKKCDDLTEANKQCEMARNSLAEKFEEFTNANSVTTLNHSENILEWHVIIEELKEENNQLHQDGVQNCKLLEVERCQAAQALMDVQGEILQLRMDNEKLTSETLDLACLNKEVWRENAENLKLAKTEIDELLSQKKILEEKFQKSIDDFFNCSSEIISLKNCKTELQEKLEISLSGEQSLKHCLQVSEQECRRLFRKFDCWDWKLINAVKEINYIADLLSQKCLENSALSNDLSTQKLSMTENAVKYNNDRNSYEDRIRVISDQLEVALQEIASLNTENNLQQSKVTDLAKNLNISQTENRDLQDKCNELNKVLIENATTRQLLCQELKKLHLLDQEKLSHSISTDSLKAEIYRLEEMNLNLQNQLEFSISTNSKQIEEIANLNFSNTALHVEVANHCERSSAIADDLKRAQELEASLSQDKLHLENELLNLRQVHTNLCKEAKILGQENDEVKIQFQIAIAKECDLKREIDLLNCQYIDAVRHCDELESERLNLSASNEELNQRVLNYDSDIQLLRNEIDDQSERLNGQKQEIDILKNQREKHFSDITIISGNLDDLTRCLVDSQETGKRLADEIDILKFESVTDCETINKLQKELMNCVQKNDETVEIINKQLADAEFKNSEKLRELDELVTERNKLKVDAGILQLKLQEITERGTIMEELNISYCSQLDDAHRLGLSSEKSHAESIEAWRQQLKESEEELKLNVAAFEKAYDEIQKLKDECQNLEEGQSILKQESSELNSQTCCLEKEASQLKSKITELCLNLKESKAVCDQLDKDVKYSEETILSLTEENVKLKESTKLIECSLTHEKLRQMEIVQRLESGNQIVKNSLDENQIQLKLSNSKCLDLQAALDAANESIQKCQQLADDRLVLIGERDKINLASTAIIFGYEGELTKKASTLSELERLNRIYFNGMNDMEVQVHSFKDDLFIYFDSMSGNLPALDTFKHDLGEDIDENMCIENERLKIKIVADELNYLSKLVCTKLSEMTLNHEALSRNLKQSEVLNETLLDKLKKQNIEDEYLRKENTLANSKLEELSNRTALANSKLEEFSNQFDLLTAENCQLKEASADFELLVKNLTTKLESLGLDNQDTELKHKSVCDDLNKVISDQAVNISELNIDLHQLRADKAVAEVYLKDRNDEIQRLQSVLVEKVESLAKNDQDKGVLEDLNTQQRRELEDKVKKQILLEEKILEYENMNYQVNESNAIEIVRLTEELLSETKNLADLTDEHEVLKASYRKVSEEGQNFQTNLLHVQQKFSNEKTINDELNVKLAKLEDYTKTLDCELICLHSKNVSQQNEELKLKAQVDDLFAQITDLTKHSEQLSLENKSLLKNNNEFDIKLQNALLQFAQSKETCVDLEMKLEEEKNLACQKIAEIKQASDLQEQLVVCYETEIKEIITHISHQDVDCVDNDFVKIPIAFSALTVSTLSRLKSHIDATLCFGQNERKKLTDLNRDYAKLSATNDALTVEVQRMREQATIDAALELSIQELQDENAKLYQKKTELENKLISAEADKNDLIVIKEDNEDQLIREKELFEAKLSDLYQLLDTVNKAKENLETELIRQRNEFEKNLAAARSDGLTKLGKSEADKRRIVEQMSESDSRTAGLRDRVRAAGEEKELLSLRLVALTRECQTHESHVNDLRAQIDAQQKQLQEATHDHKETIQLLIELKLEAELARREQRDDFNKLEEELVRLESQFASNSGLSTPYAISLHKLLDSTGEISLRGSDSASQDDDVPKKLTGVDDEVYKVLEVKHFRLVDEISDLKRDLREISDAKDLLVRENKSLHIMLDQLKHSAPPRHVPLIITNKN